MPLAGSREAPGLAQQAPTQQVLQVAAHQRIDGGKGIHPAMIGAWSTFTQVRESF